VTDKERAKDEAAITEALRLSAEADAQVITSLMRGIDTEEAERLIGKMQYFILWLLLFIGMGLSILGGHGF
jgi:hypothetical protein